MKIIEVNPDEILSSGHKILHHPHILRIYFRVYSKGCGKAIPPVPVVRTEVVLPTLTADVRILFDQYLKERPKVKYILLDGTHKTTAASLNHSKCKILVIETNSDVKELVTMESRGEIFEHIIGNSMKAIVGNIKRHLEERKVFQTVEEKTKHFVDTKKVPQYMIDKYVRK